MYKPDIPRSALEATKSPIIRSSASSLCNKEIYNMTFMFILVIWNASMLNVDFISILLYFLLNI